MKRFAILLCCACILACSNAAQAAAAEVSISPAIEQIRLSSGQTQASFTVRIANNANAPVTISLEAQDFAAVGQNGGLRFLGAGVEDGQHGLAHALRFPYKQLVIGSRQVASVPITVGDIEKLAPGGHYAAVVYRTIGTPMSGNSVNVQTAVSTLVFVSTAGGGTQAAELNTPVISPVLGALPDHLDVVFGNTGNTQATVRGVVQVTGYGKRLVSQGMINVDSGLILPGSKRLFNVELASQKLGLYWPGVYHLAVYYRYEGQADYRVYDRSFVFLNVPLLMLVLAGLILLVIVLLFARQKLVHSRSN